LHGSIHRRDVTEEGTLTTRAEWQVGSCVRLRMLLLRVPDERLILDGAGEREDGVVR